jgi:hypothetical protein
VPTDGAPTAELRPVSPDAEAHLAAIQDTLTPAENTAVRAHLAALPMPERSAWIGRVLSLPVPEAVAWIRAQRIANDVIPSSVGDVRENAPTAPVDSEPAARDVAVAPQAAVPPPTPAADPAVTDEVRTPSTPAAPSAPTAPTAAPMPAMPAPSVETNAHTHLLAIEQSLTAGERFLAHAKVAQMSPEARESLLEQLVSSTVPEGTAILRAEIQDLVAQTPPQAVQVTAPPMIGTPAVTERPPLQDATTLQVVEAQEDEADDEQADDEQADDEQTNDEQADDEQTDDEQTDNEQEALDLLVMHPERVNDADAGRSLARTSATIPSDGLPTLSPDTVARFGVIDAALTLAERMRVVELGARLSPAELRGWVAELTALPVPDALAKIRAALAAADDTANLGRKGGVS